MHGQQNIKIMYAVIVVFNSLSVRGRSLNRSLSAQRISELPVVEIYIYVYI